MQEKSAIMPKLILFDLDGTLFDSRAIILKAMKMTFESCHYQPPNPHDILSLVGISLFETMEILARKSGIITNGEQERNANHGRIEKLVSQYRLCFTHLRQNNHSQNSGFADPMFEGANAFIRQLAKQEDLILGIATGKSKRGVRYLLERENLPFFTAIQTADDAPSKPNPAMVLNALAETATEPHNALIIGDTTYDMEMAQNAGCNAIAVLWGYHSYDALQKTHARAHAKNFAELESHINAFRNHNRISQS